MKWSFVNLADVLRSAEVFVDGDWVESKDQDVNGDVRLIQLADIGDGYYIDKSSRFLTSEKARELRCTFLQKGDVLVARMPDPLGRACIFPGDLKRSVTVVDVCIIRPNPEEHDARWLMHCLNAPVCRNQMADFATGTTRTRISRGNLTKIKIPVPPLEEQKRIAEILDRAEELRSKRREAIAELDTLTQAIFLKMFGDPILNPYNFPVRKMIEIVDPERPITYGILMPGSEQMEGVKYVRVVDMKNGGIQLSGIRKTTPEISYQYRRSLLQSGDLLLSIRGHVGRLATVPEELDGANITQDTARLAIREVSTVFVRECLRTISFQQWMDKHTKGVAVRGINLGDVKLMPIILPPVDLQRKFAHQAETIEKLKAAHCASLSELDALFASLQHRAFRGEL